MFELLAQYGTRNIVLITSANHMKRAQGCLQGVGFQVTPSAGDHHATWFAWSARSFVPDL